ncbi:uncharacterized protein LOC107618554 isoform X2 [Arachis ipaensis]|uniref:uncharacterized protein LOC107618554 isoform X2 n=1 Tax=Arachis ipaensis TaxID=130454 RepID=UPI0007AF9905|nr:uncharacterized protein LOC107618554 isoform X2 [Arachis ipaensis]XP_025629009.1 uncharacterized protein LOC112722238 isoform X2 [Arachis hypogaea]QHO20117.1 uncharacterized protein DS421_11g335070 [Arachis hypogaea]
MPSHRSCPPTSREPRVCVVVTAKREKTRARGTVLVTATVTFGEAIAMHAVAGGAKRDRGKEARGTVADLHVLSLLSCSTAATCHSELLHRHCRCDGCLCLRYKHLCWSLVAVLLSRSRHWSCGCSALDFFSATFFFRKQTKTLMKSFF